MIQLPELELDHGKELRFNIVRSPDIRQQQLNKILQAYMNRSELSTCKSIFNHLEHPKGLLVDCREDWSLRAEQGVLVVRGDRIVAR